MKMPQVDLGFLVRNLKSGKNWLVLVCVLGLWYAGVDKNKIADLLIYAVPALVAGVALEDYGKKRSGK